MMLLHTLLNRRSAAHLKDPFPVRRAAVSQTDRFLQSVHGWITSKLRKHLPSGDLHLKIQIFRKSPEAEDEERSIVTDVWRNT